MLAVRVKPASNAAVGFELGSAPPSFDVILVPGAPVAWTVILMSGAVTIERAGNGPGSDMSTSVAVLLTVMPPGTALGVALGLAR